MRDIIPTAVVFVLGLSTLPLLRRWHAASEMPVFVASYLAHAAAAIAQVVVTHQFYGGGDLDSYYTLGVLNAESLRRDFVSFAPELVRVFFQFEPTLPVATFSGGSTSSLCAASGFVLLLAGDSIFAACMMIAVASFYAKAVICRAIAPSFAPELHRRILVGIMLLPTAVYWSAGLLKEPVAVFFFAPMVLGARWFASGRWLRGALFIVAFAPFVAMTKPYILAPFGIALGVWTYWQHSLKRKQRITVRPAYLVAAAAVSIAFMIALAQFFPQLTFEQIGGATAQQRQNAYGVEGGSNVVYDEAANSPVRTIAGQLALAPVALFTTLFRPTLVEVNNPMMLLNALENTALLVLLIWGLRRRGVRKLWTETLNQPALMFSLAFGLIFSVGVGLSSLNLGTLSRYRMPMMPFFAVLLAYATAPLSRSKHAGAAARATSLVSAGAAFPTVRSNTTASRD